LTWGQEGSDAPEKYSEALGDWWGLSPPQHHHQMSRKTVSHSEFQAPPNTILTLYKKKILIFSSFMVVQLFKKLKVKFFTKNIYLKKILFFLVPYLLWAYLPCTLCVS